MQRILFALAIVGLCLNNAAALDGSGTEQDPWRIQSLADFNDFAADANHWAGYTRLETDVNLAGLTYTTAVIAPDANTGYPFDGTAFTGVFDGNEHKIMNLTIDDGGAGNWYIGLFGWIGEDGEVRNLGIDGGSISGYYLVGGLAGWNSGSFSNCYSNGLVSGTGSSVGGLAGWNSGSFSKCYSTGDVNGTGDGVGGLVGRNYSYSAPIGTITNCYSTGDVSGGDEVGGLVGRNHDSVSYCYSTGYVDGDEDVGGLVGYDLFGNVSNCFWDIDTSNQSNSDVGEGKTTAEMKTRSTFTDAGWDFVEIWNIGEKQTYPYLRVHPTGDINDDDIINMLDFAIFASNWLEVKGN